MSLATCTKISGDILLNCDYPAVGGTEDVLYLMNKDDIDSYTLDTANPLIIDNISMKTGTEAYKFEGKRSSVAPGFEFAEEESSSGFVHNVNFKIFTVDPTVKQQLAALKDGRLVAIVKNNYRGTDGKGSFELYGKELGILASEMTRQLNENNGVVDVILSTEDGYLEPNPPHSVFITDLATTEALVDSLLTVAS